MQQPSFQKWGFARAKAPRPLVFAFPLMHPLLMMAADRDIFAKVPRKFCEGAGESQSAVCSGWVAQLAGDSVMLAVCLQGYEETSYTYIHIDPGMLTWLIDWNTKQNHTHIYIYIRTVFLQLNFGFGHIWALLTAFVPFETIFLYSCLLFVCLLVYFFSYFMLFFF